MFLIVIILGFLFRSWRGSLVGLIVMHFRLFLCLFVFVFGFVLVWFGCDGREGSEGREDADRSGVEWEWR